jgi:hypothetical protein
MEAMEYPARKLLAGLLALVIVLGSLVLWIGVPIAVFWAAGQLFTKSTTFVMFALVAVPLGMVLVGFLLYRVNGVYLSLRDEDTPRPPSRSGWLVSSTDERRSARLQRGQRDLIDIAMTGSAVLALVLIFVFFFFIGEMRLAPLP